MVLILAFAIGYFGGFGFLLESDAENPNTDYITAIQYTTETKKTLADPVQIQKMASALYDKAFKFPSGAVGKLSYFWNGKATNIDPSTGLDTRFGAIAKETDKDGDISYKRYGLDCSGFTTYVMWLSGVKGFEDGSQNQYNNSEPTTIADALTGDLVFIDTGGVTEHVGMVCIEDGTKYAYEINPQGFKKKILEIGPYWTSIERIRRW